MPSTQLYIGKIKTVVYPKKGKITQIMIQSSTPISRRSDVLQDKDSSTRMLQHSGIWEMMTGP